MNIPTTLPQDVYTTIPATPTASGIEVLQVCVKRDGTVLYRCRATGKYTAQHCLSVAEMDHARSKALAACLG